MKIGKSQQIASQNIEFEIPMNPLKNDCPAETTMAILPRKMDEMMINHKKPMEWEYPLFIQTQLQCGACRFLSTLPKMKLDNAARSRK